MKARAIFPTLQLPAELAKFFSPEANVWEWLPAIAKALDGVRYIDPAARVHPTAILEGNYWIGANVEVRPFCYIRGGVIALEGAILGHACEYKNSILMQRVESCHRNYVGDSILGAGAHLGAGAVCANVRHDKRSVRVAGGPDSGLTKVGAFIGDASEVGCNAVLMPGTVLMPRACVGAAATAKNLVGTGEVVK